MDKEQLIEILQSIPGNPEVFMYDGEYGNLNPIDHFKIIENGDELVFTWHETDYCKTTGGYVKLIELDITNKNS